MSSKRLRSGLAVVAIGVGLFATLGESSTKTDSNTATNNAPNAGQAGGGSGGTSAPAADKSKPIAIGTPAEVAKGWTVTVVSAETNADATLKAANDFNKPEAGKQFVTVKVTVTNNSDKPAAPLTNVKLSLLPGSGVAVDSAFTCTGLPDKFDSMAQMQPGATLTGNLCFQVKTEEVPTVLLLAEPQFTVDKVQDQKFFAIQ
jgi:hypothetical protein